MSKILKVKLDREDDKGGTHYEYPSEYDAQKIKVLAYETFNPDNLRKVKARTARHEYCIGVVKDEDAPQFLRSDDITELTDREAEQLGSNWRPQVEKVADSQRVLKLTAKATRGESLTQKERDALDPEQDESGVNKSKSFGQLLKEAKASLDAG